MSTQPDDDTLDDALTDAFAPLRRLEPTPASRAANRAAVALALARTSPFAHPRALRHFAKLLATAACALLVGFAAGWSAHGHSPTTKARVAHDDPPAALSQDVPSTAPQSPPEPTHYATEIYLCGVGRLSSSSGYTFQEFDR